MLIQILVEDDLRAGIISDAHRFIFEYKDSVSSSKVAAAQRAWHITSAAITRLEGEELELRMKWDQISRGNAVSIGDIVAVDGDAYLCQPGGWERTSLGLAKK